MIRSWKRCWLAGVTGLLIAQAGCVAPEGFGLSGFVKDTQSTPSGNNGLPSSQAAKACMEVAVSFDKKGNDFNAIEQYEKVLQIEPKNKEAMRRLTVLYDHLGEFAKAGAYYEKLEKLTPRDANLFTDWGYSCFLQNKYTEAEKHLRHALELKPDHVKARINLGMALGQQERYQEAFKAFRDAKLSEADCALRSRFHLLLQGQVRRRTAGTHAGQQARSFVQQGKGVVDPDRSAVAAPPGRSRGQGSQGCTDARTDPACRWHRHPACVFNHHRQDACATCRRPACASRGGVNWIPVDHGAMKPAAE